jgi:exonuclease VII large subunit
VIFNGSFYPKNINQQQLNQSKQSTLKAMEPGYIVQRGFSILRDETGNIVSSVKVIQKGSIIHASVRDGKIVGTVNSVNSVMGEER